MEHTKKTKRWPVPNEVFIQCLEIYDQFCKREFQRPMIGGVIAGNAMKEIIRKVRKAFQTRMEKEPTNDDLVLSWNVILSNYHKWGWYKGKFIELAQINSKLGNIMEQIKGNGGSSKQVGLTPEEEAELKMFNNG